MGKLVFKFKPVVLKKIVEKISVIQSKVEGLLIIKDGVYYVKYNNKDYPITEKSYKTKGKRIIYSKTKDRYNNYVKIIRTSDTAFDVGTNHYLPFRVGLIAKGKLIQDSFNIKFHVVSCYNPSSMEEHLEAELNFKDNTDYNDK